MSDNGTILIVEDNEMSLKMAQSLLQLSGYNTLEATNADSGIALAREHLPDLILMDMHLPVKSGYEACEELKARAGTSQIPIVAFTALAMQEEQEKAISHGCVGVITKPIEVKQFAHSIQGFLQTRHQESPNSVGLKSLPELSLHQQAECPGCLETKQLRQDFENFLLHTSHDLQNPLRKIQQFMKFLDLPTEVDESNERSVYSQGIYRSLKEMEEMLQGLLSLARVNLKETPFQEVVLDEVVSETLAAYQQDLVALDARVKVDTLTCIQGEAAQIRKVIEELLKNSLKFRSPERPLKVQIRGSKVDRDFYEICFEDNGIGFSESAAERVFEPFMRLNGVSKYPGNGLGLAIVKKIVERHGGSVTAQSQQGHSTAIRIQLPCPSRSFTAQEAR